jgi:O-antigen/teichoic acid export membrane protein
MKKKQVVRNAYATTTQVAICGLLMFLLYRYLLATIGVEEMGIWSVVLATTSASRLSELGLTGSVVKFVAKHLALKDRQKAGDVIQTAVISLGLFLGVILGLSYFPSLWILSHIIPAHGMPLAHQIFPFALVSLWITMLSGVFQSGLDGCQRADLRAYFNILNSILTLSLAVILIPKYGLMGLAYVQLSLSSFLMSLSWVYLKSELKTLPYLPYIWKKIVFKELVRYGLNFQVITFVDMFFDPMTKALLTRFGNLSMVGYYEMSSRMIMQFRGILIAPIQILVPVIAGLHETDSNRILNLYKNTYRLQVFLSLPLYSWIFSIIPSISDLWIGFYEPYFILFGQLLTLGWLVNGLINPAYFTNLGIGDLKPNTIAHVLIGILNATLGIFLGSLLGGRGVVIAWIIALILGSSVVIIAFHHNHRISLYEMFHIENIWLIVGCAIGIIFTSFVYGFLHPDLTAIWMLLICSLTFLSCIAFPCWWHPMRPHLLAMIARR